MITGSEISERKVINMNKVGLQIYTVREFTGTPDGLKDTFLNIRKAGYTSVQTAGQISDIESAKYYKECAKNADVAICGTHFDWNIIQNNLDEAMKIHDILETKNMGSAVCLKGQENPRKLSLRLLIRQMPLLKRSANTDSSLHITTTASNSRSLTVRP